MRLSNERYEEIKRTVVNLFVEYEVRCIPVSGFELGMKMGIEIIPYSAFNKNKQNILFHISEDGFCVQTNKWRIYYNDKQYYRRINNTLFHEIGHIVLDHSIDSDLAESEVQFFAKYALAPPPLNDKLNIKNVIEIYEKFDISWEAAENALKYYHKWLSFRRYDLMDYELKLLNLFNFIA